MAIPQFRLPRATERSAVFGHTGSGKTHYSTFLLSHANWDKIPWIIVDYKLEPFFREIEQDNFHSVTHIGLDEKLPKKPGLYIVQPVPFDDEAVDQFFWRIWEKGKTGIFVDEGLNLPKPPRYRGYPAILSQGRTKRIPTITVSQKAYYVPQHVYSEADFITVFYLSDWRDRERIMEFTPLDLSKDLPEYHAYWHDVSKRANLVLKPLPDRDSILDTFHRRLGEQRGTTWNGSTSHGHPKTSLRFL
jgi:hypothetical protein